MHSRRIPWRFALITGIALVSGCGGNDAGRGAVDTLILARNSDAMSLDPAATIAAADWTVIALMYRRLVSIDPDTGEPRPDLARSWRVSEDGRTWTIELKDELLFSDGSSLTAEAVAFSLRRLLRSRGGTVQSFAIMDSIEVVGPLTVRITLDRPELSFVYALSLGIAGIVNPAIMAHEHEEDLGSRWLAEQSAGSGPYRLVSWQRSQRIVLERNPHYAGSAPRMASLVFQIIPDSTSQRLKLEAGGIDIVESVLPNAIDNYRRLEGVRVEKVPASSEVFFLAFNTTREPFDDARVRRAISLAIDYGTLVGSMLKGNAEIPSSPVPPGVIGHDPGLPKPRRDLEEARRLLSEAGHSPGLQITLLLAKESTLGEYLQSNLRDVGIEVTLQRLAPSALDAARAAGNFDVFYGGWTIDYPHPAAFLVPAFSSGNIGGSNFSRYSNPKLDSLFRDAAAADKARQDNLYRQAAEIVMRERPFVLLFAPHRAVAVRHAVQGLEVNPYQPYILDLKNVKLRVETSN